jgi:hypothetical protein
VCFLFRHYPTPNLTGADLNHAELDGAELIKAHLEHVNGSIGSYSAQPISSAARFEYALDRLPPPFTAYGLQSIIQHVAHFPMGSGTAC